MNPALGAEKIDVILKFSCVFDLSPVPTGCDKKNKNLIHKDFFGESLCSGESNKLANPDFLPLEFLCLGYEM